MKYLIGIQPTGKLHIGNYLGCLKRGLQLQEDNDVTFLVANYHSLTTNSYNEVTHSELERLGCLNIKYQTPEYTELFFELSCKLNLGTLTKMPQYKDKKDSVEFDLGLLLYPVLMSADIIINDPDVVIIGRDQVPHLELCNDIAKRYNGKSYKYEFGDVDKIMSLSDPSKKMSKSGGDKSILYLFDENYERKIKSANSNEDGVKNLYNIANGIGIFDTFDKNIDLKNSIIKRMSETFK